MPDKNAVFFLRKALFIFGPSYLVRALIRQYLVSHKYLNIFLKMGVVKFIYSEKATKFCEIFPLLLTNNLFFCVSRPILNFQ